MNEFYVIGLMSGTSLDGLDIAYCKFVKTIDWSFEILQFKTVEYKQDFRERLLGASQNSEEELQELSFEFGVLMAEELSSFVQQYQISRIDLVASHGHTVFHQPEKGITLQIGSPKPLFDLLNVHIVYDFRTQDVLRGGQGAPLVPLVDKILFSEYDACLNLGGFSNISFDCEKERVAFDICPVNIVLNHLANKLGFDFDEKGQIASSSVVNDELLEYLNGLPYYKNTYPKSLGREWVEENIFSHIEHSDLSLECLMRTIIEHIACQIGKVVKEYKLKRVLLSGGGVFNDFLIDRIQSIVPNCCEKSDYVLIEAKEAMAFAFLGLLRFRGDVNILSSVTGSDKNHSSGKIYRG